MATRPHAHIPRQPPAMVMERLQAAAPPTTLPLPLCQVDLVAHLHQVVLAVVAVVVVVVEEVVAVAPPAEVPCHKWVP